MAFAHAPPDILGADQVAVPPGLESCTRPFEEFGVQLLAAWQFECHHAGRSERRRTARLPHERIRWLLVPIRARSTRLNAQSNQPP